MQWRTSFSALVADGSENEFAQLKQSLGHSYISIYLQAKTAYNVYEQQRRRRSLSRKDN